MQRIASAHVAFLLFPQNKVVDVDNLKVKLQVRTPLRRVMLYIASSPPSPGPAHTSEPMMLCSSLGAWVKFPLMVLPYGSWS